MKLALLVIATVFVLSSCDVLEKKMPENSGNSNANGAINTENTEGYRSQDSLEYLAKDENELSEFDIETAYEMCVSALTEYYKAVWNGSDIILDTFINNESLKQYMLKKIQYQFDVNLKHNLTKNMVQDIHVGAWEAEFTDNEDGGYLYLNIPVEINKYVGSYGEVTEFLVRNINGKLVIVDWYTGTKDSYDFIVRGENQVIDNPNIWNESEWVKQLESRQIELTASTDT